MMFAVYVCVYVWDEEENSQNNNRCHRRYIRDENE